MRTALSLSAITGRSFAIERIRARRRQPGIRPQHLAAVRAMAEICQAETEGVTLESRSLCFAPTVMPQAGDYCWDVGTAGAVSLIFQCVLWPLAVAEGDSQVKLIGGTHVEWSPPMDYVQKVYLPVLSTLSDAKLADLRVERWGWYPRGGGVIQAHIRGSIQLGPLTMLERGALRHVSVVSAASNLADHIRQRQAQRADQILRKRGIKPGIEVVSPPAIGKGTFVFVLAEYAHTRAGFTSYGRIRKPAEQVAKEACRNFGRYHKREQPVDEYLADQLLLPLALADGVSTYAVSIVTQHLLTDAWLIQQFVPAQIDIKGQEGEPGTVRINPTR